MDICSSLIVAACIFIRYAVGLWGHSGQNTPPMYGDFEAQRHWMEITSNLEIEDWYRNTPDNNLLYWGLDYPPLTAYVSWIFGVIAKHILPDLVKMNSSRGHETLRGKTFMRCTVIICDLVVLIPSFIFILKFLVNIKTQNKLFMYNLLFSLVCPSIILIDHGHFQYNNVSIGLTLLATSAILSDYDLLGSVLFCLSLNFKQMTLYYAPIFFIVLLRKCFLKYDQKHSILSSAIHLIKVGAVVILSFSLLWLPFCRHSSSLISAQCISSLQSILIRIFPFHRGLFEDKVSNFWYSLSVLYDVRFLFETQTLIRCSLCLTLLMLLPILYNLLLYNITPRTFLLSLTNSSLVFFLFSFHVHEKSLLLSLVPCSLLLADDPLFIGWFQIVGMFTMYPLLIRDNQTIPYFALFVIYICIYLMQFDSWLSKDLCRRLYTATQRNNGTVDNISAVTTLNAKNFNISNIFYCHPLRFVSFVNMLYLVVSATGVICLHIASATVTPPARYPDLYPALFALFGFCNLIWSLVYLITWQLYLKSIQSISSNKKDN